MNTNTALTRHTSTDIVSVNHHNLEIIPFENNINVMQNEYKNKVDGIMELNEYERKAIKTETELATFFGITQEKIASLLKKDYPGFIHV